LFWSNAGLNVLIFAWNFLLLLAACSALASGSGVDIWSGCAFLQIGTIALFSLKNCVLLRRAYKPLFHF
jgi:hypothetical protein